MAKYHLNPEKGPMPCRAKTVCPYGEDAPHFSNLVTAQAAYEAALQAELPLASLQRKLPEGLLLRRLDELMPEEAEALADGKTLRELQKTLRKRRDSGARQDATLRAYASGDPFSGPSQQTLAALRARRALELRDEGLMSGALVSHSPCARWSGDPKVLPSAELSVVGAFVEQDLGSASFSTALPEAVVNARSPRFTKLSRHESVAVLEARDQVLETGQYKVYAVTPHKLSPNGIAVTGLLSQDDEEPGGLLTYANGDVSPLRARCETLAVLHSSGLSFAVLTGEGMDLVTLDASSLLAPGSFDETFTVYREQNLLPWLSEHSFPAA